MLMRKMLAVWLVVVTVAIAGAAAQSTPGGCKAIDSIILCNPGEFTCFGADIDGIQDDLVKNDCVMCPATTYRNNNTGGCCVSCVDPDLGNNATGVILLPTTSATYCSEWRNILNSRCYCPQNFVFSAWIPIDSQNNGVTAKCAQCPSGYVAPEGNIIERDVPSTSTIAFSACLNAAIDDAKCELLNGCARCKANYEWAGPAGASECRWIQSTKCTANSVNNITNSMEGAEMKSLDDCECLPNFLGDNGVVAGRVGPNRVCVPDPLLCSYCFPLQSDLALDYQLYALGNISLMSNPVEGAVVAADTLTFRSSSSLSKINGSVTSFGVIASKIVCEPGAQTQTVPGGVRYLSGNVVPLCLTAVGVSQWTSDPLNLDFVSTGIEVFSQRLKNLTDTATVKSNNVITVTGPGATVFIKFLVVTVSLTTLTSTESITVANAHPDTILIINVKNAPIVTLNRAVVINYPSTSLKRTVWNFPETTTLTVFGQLDGHLLAPQASLKGTNNPSIMGTAFVKNFIADPPTATSASFKFLKRVEGTSTDAASLNMFGQCEGGSVCTSCAQLNCDTDEYCLLGTNLDDGQSKCVKCDEDCDPRQCQDLKGCSKLANGTVQCNYESVPGNPTCSLADATTSQSTCTKVRDVFNGRTKNVCSPFSTSNPKKSWTLGVSSASNVIHLGSWANSRASCSERLGSFVIVSNCGFPKPTWTDNADGTARFVGFVKHYLDFWNLLVLRMDLNFTGKLPAPPAAPVKRLDPRCYSQACDCNDNRIVNTTQWTYYSTVTGTLRGQGRLSNVLVDVTLRANSRPAQVGFGANGRSLVLGAYAEIAWILRVGTGNSRGIDFLSSGTAEFNAELGNAPACPLNNLAVCVNGQCTAGGCQAAVSGLNVPAGSFDLSRSGTYKLKNFAKGTLKFEGKVANYGLRVDSMYTYSHPSNGAPVTFDFENALPGCTTPDVRMTYNAADKSAVISGRACGGPRVQCIGKFVSPSNAQTNLARDVTIRFEIKNLDVNLAKGEATASLITKSQNKGCINDPAFPGAAFGLVLVASPQSKTFTISQNFQGTQGFSGNAWIDYRGVAAPRTSEFLFTIGECTATNPINVICPATQVSECNLFTAPAKRSDGTCPAPSNNNGGGCKVKSKDDDDDDDDDDSIGGTSDIKKKLLGQSTSETFEDKVKKDLLACSVHLQGDDRRVTVTSDGSKTASITVLPPFTDDADTQSAAASSQVLANIAEQLANPISCLAASPHGARLVEISAFSSDEGFDFCRDSNGNVVPKKDCSSGGLPVVAVIGIAVAGGAALIVAAVLAGVFLNKRRKRNSPGLMHQSSSSVSLSTSVPVQQDGEADEESSNQPPPSGMLNI